MESYKIIRKGMKIRRALEGVIETHGRYRNSYLWKAAGNARQRRQQEFVNHIEFDLNGVIYSIEQEVYTTCRNVCYSLGVWMDGERKTVTAIKHLVGAQ